ncbi:MAG: hypothetical protein JSS53_09755, partial [Proteobacteria bacterium]|nr:hypothetical protein [Pseudomonadota bacterium]
DEIMQNGELSPLSSNCLKKYKENAKSEDDKDKPIKKSSQRTRRFCKYILGIPETVHFLLGSFSYNKIDIDRVLSKYNPDRETKDGAFTTSELRYIYKHWEELKTKVKFYRDGNECNAPWVDNAQYWQENFKRKTEAGKPLPQQIPLQKELRKYSDVLASPRILPSQKKESFMSLSKIPLTFFGSPTFKPKGNENTPEKSLEAGIVNGAQSSKKRLRLDDFELPEIPHETGTVNSRQSLKVKLVFDDFELPGKSSIELLKFPTLPSVNSNRDKGSSKEEHPKTTTLLPKCG